MKKLICVFASIFLIISLFAACDMNALVKLEHEEDAKLMLNYLSEGDLENAKAMMHADVKDASALEQISEYLNGRKIKDMKTLGSHKQSMTNNGVTTKQEEATFKVTLDDDETMTLSVLYVEDHNDRGFKTFRLALGN